MNNISDTKKFAEKYFSFLVTDFGFEKPKEKWVSYEFHIKYYKGNIEIGIAIEGDGASLPWVTLTHHGQSNDFDLTITPSNYYYMESLEDDRVLRDLYKNRNERYNPKVEKFIEKFVGKANLDRSELDNDYKTWGQKELETVLRINADIIKKHPQILQGDVSAFPKRKEPKDLKVDLYEPTDKGAMKVKTERFKNIKDFMEFAKGKKKK